LLLAGLRPKEFALILNRRTFCLSATALGFTFIGGAVAATLLANPAAAANVVPLRDDRDVFGDRLELVRQRK